MLSAAMGKTVFKPPAIPNGVSAVETKYKLNETAACIAALAVYPNRMAIAQAGSVKSNKRCDTVDELLEDMVDEDSLCHVIIKVRVWERTNQDKTTF